MRRKKVEIPESLLVSLREVKERLIKKQEEARDYIRFSLAPDPDIKYSRTSASEESSSLSPTEQKEIEEIINKEPPLTFRDVLFRLIDSRNFIDSYVYKKAKVDRRLFSKIRSGQSKHVSKKTAIRLVLALELSIDEANSLLTANHDSLYEDSYFDAVIKWCIENRKYDLAMVDNILYSCGLDSIFDKKDDNDVIVDILMRSGFKNGR